MDMDVPDGRIELAREDQSLAEAAAAIGRWVAAEIVPECLEQLAEPRHEERGRRATEYPQRFLVKIFREITGRRADGAVHRVNSFVGRMPQRPDFERDAPSLQRQYFLRDERFGKPGISFHDDGCLSHGAGRKTEFHSAATPTRPSPLRRAASS